jgi:hypothetical protein
MYAQRKKIHDAWGIQQTTKEAEAEAKRYHQILKNVAEM